MISQVVLHYQLINQEFLFEIKFTVTQLVEGQVRAVGKWKIDFYKGSPE